MKPGKLKTGTWLLIFLTILGSCRSNTKYRPAIYGHDYVAREIITPKTHIRISTGDKKFNEFVSIKLDDLAKLSLILKDAKLSKKVRIIVENFDKEVRERQKIQLTDLE